MYKVFLNEAQFIRVIKAFPDVRFKKDKREETKDIDLFIEKHCTLEQGAFVRSAEFHSKFKEIFKYKKSQKVVGAYMRVKQFKRTRQYVDLIQSVGWEGLKI